MLHARVIDSRAAKAVPVQVREGATLNEVLTAAGVTPRNETALSQNGRRASGADALKPGATVAQMPIADNG